MFPEDAALSPLDGRYRSETAPLAKHLSEEALNKYRLHVEVEWLIYFASLFDARAPLTDEEKQLLRDIPLSFDADMRDRLAQFEAETRHDVKAVEYFLAEQMRQHPDTALPSWVQAAHIFATSEDINNLAHALGVRDAVQQVWIPAAQTLVDELREMAKNLAAQPMLANVWGCHARYGGPGSLRSRRQFLHRRPNRGTRREVSTAHLAKRGRVLIGESRGWGNQWLAAQSPETDL